ncbi:MAG: hypothetical protein NTX73_09465 [Rhodobacterales bacterium]|nr:hypothetical protein [Rhodobacterales bacterium]
MFNYIGFTRDMTAGRGFIALGAVLLGARHPVGAMLSAPDGTEDGAGWPGRLA